MEFQDLSYLPFPTQSGRVPLFPSVKALGLMCFPACCGKRDCEVGKGSFPPFLPSLLPLFLPTFFSPLSSVSSDFFFLIWIPFQKCQDYLRFAPNQTQTTAAAGNQENFTKNLPDQQNTPPFHFSTGRVSEPSHQGPFPSCRFSH